MKSKPSIWQRMGMHEWFLKKDPEKTVHKQPAVTPNDVYRYIGQKFDESVGQLSFASRVVFFHEYIICFSAPDYQEFMDSKKGIFGLIVQEAVRGFYEKLQTLRTEGKTVEPSASKWVFRFVSHPDYVRGDLGFIGKLLPGAATQPSENLRVTFIPRQTGIAQTLDVNPEILKGFTFYSEGYYEVPFTENLVYDSRKISSHPTAGIARLETILPDKAYAGKKLEYLMQDEEIVVSGKDESRTAANIFKVPSEWVNTPHLRLRHEAGTGKFFIASFGEKTVVNEQELQRSAATNPAWTEIAVNSRIVLNGIVGINLFKS
jgi:hypothetical protein